MANDVVITGARINWNLEYDNHPELVVEVDELPATGLFHSYPVNDGELFVRETSGFATYYFANPHNQRGYGSVEFKLPMDDGTIRVVKGPWSSRCSVVNTVCPNHYMEVTITLKGEQGGYHGALRVEIVNELVKQLGAYLFRLWDKYGEGEIDYEISSRPDGFWKPGWEEEYARKDIIGPIPPELV